MRTCRSSQRRAVSRMTGIDLGGIRPVVKLRGDHRGDLGDAADQPRVRKPRSVICGWPASGSVASTPLAHPGSNAGSGSSGHGRHAGAGRPRWRTDLPRHRRRCRRLVLRVRDGLAIGPPGTGAGQGLRLASRTRVADARLVPRGARAASAVSPAAPRWQAGGSSPRRGCAVPARRPGRADRARRGQLALAAAVRSSAAVRGSRAGQPRRATPSACATSRAGCVPGPVSSRASLRVPPASWLSISTRERADQTWRSVGRAPGRSCEPRTAPRAAGRARVQPAAVGDHGGWLGRE